MNFVDEIYKMYRKQLTGDEEDAVALVLNLLEDHDKNDFVKMITDMDESEIYQMVAMWLIEMLKVKMAQEGVGSSNFKNIESDSTIH